MHRLTGSFSTREAADKAMDALIQAGVSSGAITIEAAGEGDGQVLSAEVDTNVADAARAIFNEAGATGVNEVDRSEADVEDEEAANFRDPIPPVLPTPR